MEGSSSVPSFKQRWFVGALVLVQLAIVGLLVYEILYDTFEPSISPIHLEGVIRSSETLQYFAEPVPGEQQHHITPSWGQGGVITYDHNALGARDDMEYELEKPTSTYRIALVGDSHTYGLFVPLHETFGKRLENLLEEQLSCEGVADFEVLNFAFTGYDAEYTLERLKLRALPTDPDLIIWNVSKDDLTELSEYIHAYVFEGEYAAQKDNPDHELWRHVWTEAAAAMRETYEMAEIEMYQLNKLKSVRDHYEKALVFVASAHTDTNIMSDEAYFSSVRRAAHQTDAEYVEVSGQTLREDGVLPDGHLNALGHEMVAQRIFENLKEHTLSGCVTKNAE